jgi:Transcriptional regulators containing a DNA-binding HTH domain and an aminotransferase domain (MocR family) and their eukaryotic orthologs
LRDDPLQTDSQVAFPPPIKSFDREGRVIYVSSFSKIIAPGLRVGFIVAKGEIAEKLSLLEQLDFSTSTINQYVVANLLRRGLVSKRMTTLAMHYSEKMKILTESLDDAGIFKFNPPKCGFFALVDLRTDAERVFEVATKDGLSFVKAKAFFLRGGDTMARLSVTIPTAEEIKEGVTILKRSVLDVKL